MPRDARLAFAVVALLFGPVVHAQLAVSPGSVSVTLALGETAEHVVTVTNTGSSTVSSCLSFDRPLQHEGSALRLASTTAGGACGEMGEVLLRVDHDDVPGWDPAGLTMTPNGASSPLTATGAGRTS